MNKKFLGVTLGETAFGKRLADGSSAIISENNELFAVAEERLQKRKHAEGHELSCKAILRETGLSDNDIDFVVTSSCCEKQRDLIFHNDFQNSEYISCNHHFSHAIGTYSTSSFERALVCVFDGGGNTKDEINSENWWRASREQHSYYIFDESGGKKVGEDFTQPFELGFGEIYRAFVKFLKLGSAENAGKMMALSAYGDPTKIPYKIFEVDDTGSLSSCLKYSEELGPSNVDKIVSKYFSSKEILCDFVALDDDISLKADVAAWVQKELEVSLVRKIQNLTKEYKINNVCLTGGVAYNCKANGVLASDLRDINFYVSPFAGDIGQSIGNVCFGKFNEDGKIPRLNINKTYLGSVVECTHSDIQDALEKHFNSLNTPDTVITNDIHSAVADKLFKGNIGAVHFGRAELGPRALGNRSILALPNCKAIRDRVNHLKNRELFMPLAPVMFADTAKDFFEVSESTLSLELMTTAVKAKRMAREIQGVLHVDNTARVQLVRRDEDSDIAKILHALESKGIAPILLNTSFNPKNRPISDSLDDAIHYFSCLELDFLALDKNLLTKDTFRDRPERLQEFVLFGKKFIDIPLTEVELLLSNFQIETREYFNLYMEYTKWFEDQRKSTTIRFKQNTFQVPKSTVLPLYTNVYYDSETERKFYCNIHISKISIKKFAELNEADALRDGFKSLDELQDALTNIYGKGILDGNVMIFEISKVFSSQDCKVMPEV